MTAPTDQLDQLDQLPPHPPRTCNDADNDDDTRMTSRTLTSNLSVQKQRQISRTYYSSFVLPGDGGYLTVKRCELSQPILLHEAVSLDTCSVTEHPANQSELQPQPHPQTHQQERRLVQCDLALGFDPDHLAELTHGHKSSTVIENFLARFFAQRHPACSSSSTSPSSRASASSTTIVSASADSVAEDVEGQAEADEAHVMLQYACSQESILLGKLQRIIAHNANEDGTQKMQIVKKERRHFRQHIVNSHEPPETRSDLLPCEAARHDEDDDDVDKAGAATANVRTRLSALDMS